MKLKETPELLAFFATYLADTDVSQDEDTARAFMASAAPSRREQIVTQAKRLLGDSDLPIDELGSEANRWFADSDEARIWLGRLIETLESVGEASSASDASVVKDSNGAILAEGDTVQVIKDLKVKGGSSDLKRGTLIKRIHLVDDPAVVECRVDGSTLVLKTCFLKKA